MKTYGAPLLAEKARQNVTTVWLVKIGSVGFTDNATAITHDGTVYYPNPVSLTGFRASDASPLDGGTIRIGNGDLTGSSYVLNNTFKNALVDIYEAWYKSEFTSTNLLLQSNDFAAVWTGLGGATQSVTGPDGGISAWSSPDTTFLQATPVSLTSGSPYTLSAYIKKAAGAVSVYPIFQVHDGGTKIAQCVIDPFNGIVATQTAYTGFTILASSSSIVSINSDYWRVSLTFTPEATVGHNCYLASAARTSMSTTELNGIYSATQVWYGAQLNPGSAMTKYVPTQGEVVVETSDALMSLDAGSLIEADLVFSGKVAGRPGLDDNYAYIAVAGHRAPWSNRFPRTRISKARFTYIPVRGHRYVWGQTILEVK